MAGQPMSTSALPVKLPRLELPKFDGNALRWQEFWDSFESTIHRAEMSNIDKFKYRRNFLTGDAAKLVDGFRLIDANYETVIEALQQRFGNPEVSIFAHFEHLLALTATGRDLHNLQRTYDECEKHIRSLVALGLEEATFGRVFIPIILSKLTRHTRVELHCRNGSQLWTLNNLPELFKQEITAQQMGDLTLHDRDRFNSQPAQKSQWEPRIHRPGQRRSTPPTSTFVQSNKQVRCKGTQFSDQCLKVADVQGRRKIAQTNGHSFKGLSTKHHIAQCPKSSKCYHCSDNKHHSAFCMKRNTSRSEAAMCAQEQVTTKQQNPEEKINTSISAANIASAFSAVSNSLVYMQMARIRYNISNRGATFARIYLDPGSSCSYITTEAAKRLGLHQFGRATVSNARFEDRTRSTKSYKCVHLPIPRLSGEDLKLEVFVTDHISVPLEKLPLCCTKYPILSNLPLADTLTDYRESVNIDILIGGDYYYNIVTGETIKLGDGLTASRSERKLRNIDVERFWSLDDIGIKENPYQLDDDHAVHQFNKSIHLANGRYDVGWPWKDGRPDLPSNRHLALKRLRSLLCKLKSQPDIFTSYNATIQNQLDNGTIDRVDKYQDLDGSQTLVHYVPHDCVVKGGKSTTKLRIVYDASCKASPHLPSLRGPVFLNDLCGLILKFRAHQIALVSDIEKAFLQVGLRVEDRDVTRFFWLKTIDNLHLDGNLVTYRFTKVPFGIISRPFLLEATIRHHHQQANSEVAQLIVQHTYVDNVIFGIEDEEEGRQFYIDAKQLFGQIKMNLREWFTNSAALKSIIAASDAGTGCTTTVLGLRWNFNQDTMYIKKVPICHITGPKTKRQLLQMVSSLFDSCGLYAPITVRAKILMQRLWKLELRWDSPLPDEALGIQSRKTKTSAHPTISLA